MSLGILKNQRGFGAPIIIVLIVVILGVAGGAYYFVTKDKDGDSAAKQQVATECNRAIEDKDLCKMVANYDINGNYTMTMTTTSTDGSATWVVKADGDNSHTIMTTGDGTATEYISFDNSTYMKMPGASTWTKLPAAPEGSPEEQDLTADIKDDFDFADEEAVNYTKVGKEACGSLTCFHYRYNDPTDTASSFDFWFDDKDYKIRKMTNTQDGNSSEIVFTYGDAKVSAPTDYQEQPQTDASGISEEQMRQLMEQYGGQ